MYCISDLDLVDKCIRVVTWNDKSSRNITQTLHQISLDQQASSYTKKKKKKKNRTEATTTFESLVNLALKCKYVYKHTSCTCWKFSGERDFFSHIQLSNHSIRNLVTRAVHNYGVLLINCIAYTKHKPQALLLQVFCCLFLSTDPHRQRVLPNSMELQS